DHASARSGTNASTDRYLARHGRIDLAAPALAPPLAPDRIGLTSFIGRDGPLREVAGLLAEHRLVTGTGPGGAGEDPPGRPAGPGGGGGVRPDLLAVADNASLDAILAASPELAAVAASVRAFAAIMNERRGRKLFEPWMTAATATGEPALRFFVTGLRADQDAVTNGLTLPWSSGAVEGH